jgi:hypothetical protein
MNIDEIIEKFKNSDYIKHADEHKRIRKLCSKLKKDIKNIDKQEFDKFMNQKIFHRNSIKRPNINKIVENFDTNKPILVNLILGTEPVEKRIKKALTINGVSLYTMSMILSATNDDNEYILYHDDLIPAIKKLCSKFQIHDIPICSNRGNTVKNAKGYIKFNESCKILRDILGFSSLDELHEFLWHGHHTEWEFGKTKYS